MSNFYRSQQAALVFPAITSVSGTRTAHQLNSAYVHRTSGSGFAVRLRVPKTGNLTDWYIILDATTGTRANVTVRGQTYGITGTSTATQPGTNTIGDSVDVGLPASDDKWIRFELPAPIAVTRDDVIWFVVQNIAGAPATDFPSVLATNNQQPSSVMIAGPIATVTTANGFNTAGTVNAARINAMCVIDGQSYGSVYSTTTSPFVSNLLRRGAQFSNDLKNFRIVGFIGNSIPTNSNTLEFCDATASPGTTLFTRPINLTGTTATATAITFFDPIELSGSNPFNVVFSPSTNSVAVPAAMLIEGYADFPSVFDNLNGFTNTIAVQDNGAGGWTLRNDAQPFMQLICELITTPSSGGLLSQGFII